MREEGVTMLYTFPDYYSEFQCIAGDCEDTCCAGWQIVIDTKTLKKYGNAMLTTGGDISHRLLTSIQWWNRTFRRTADGRCAFLNQKNLCDLYKELGEKSLCKTCKLYPRHIEEFEGIREVTLSFSCPEVARIVMNHQEPVVFVEYEEEGDESYDDYDPFLYFILADTRTALLNMAQNRDIPIPVRLLLMEGLAHDIQRRINDSHLFSCEELMDRYAGDRAIAFFEKKWEDQKKDAVCRIKDYKKTRRLFRKLHDLELLRDEWEDFICEAEVLLFKNNPENGFEKHEVLSRDFDHYVKEHFPQWEIQQEQILVYFISTYFCGAVYDGEALNKANLAFVSLRLIREILIARWIKNDRSLTTEDVVEIVYRYSRELEHSDPNLEDVETWR